jgi:hypothetical protein
MDNSGEIPKSDQTNSTTEHNSGDIVERMEQLKKRRVETQTATYLFPFLTDKRFLASPNKDVLEKLAGASNTVNISQEVIKSLNIGNHIEIVRLIPDDEHKMVIIPGLGIGGRAISDNEVGLYFSPNDPNVLESLAKWNDRQIAHELTHIARNQSGKKRATLLDAMLNEGLATYHEEHWKGKYEQTPWGHALTQEQLKEEWVKAQSELSVDLNNQKYEGWFFGINNTHQRWSGYSLGNAIVNSYFQDHPGTTIAEVVRMDSKDIFENSKFKPT